MNTDPECLFCKIVAGEIPSTKVYEDDNTLAFLDINPVNIGHTLVIPKGHHTNFYETPNETLGKIVSVAKEIATSQKNTLDAEGINIISNNDPVAGQVIFHTHIHVIPRYSSDGFEHWKGVREYEDGEAKEIAEKIKKGL